MFVLILSKKIPPRTSVDKHLKRIFVGNYFVSVERGFTMKHLIFLMMRYKDDLTYSLLTTTSLIIFLTVKEMSAQSGPNGSPDFQIRLAGGNESHGRVEMLIGGQWGTICSDGWDDFDANVICRMLGFKGVSRALRGQPSSPTAYGPGTGPIHMRAVTCNGNEQTILDCQSQRTDTTVCNHSEDAAVTCFNIDSSSPSTTPRPPWAQVTQSTLPPKICTTPNWNIELRLADDSTSQSGVGKVMYRRNEAWRGVCNDKWGQNEANVVCRMLCYNPVYSVPVLVKGFYGNVSREGFWLAGVQCRGTEADISQCSHLPWGDDAECHPEDVAAVNCLGNLISAPKAPTVWVSCEDPNYILVVLSLKDEPSLLPSYISVTNSSGSPIAQCFFNASRYGDFIHVFIPLSGCNTTRTSNATSIIYSNFISYKIPPTSSVITRSDTRILMTSCVIARDGSYTGSFGVIPFDTSLQFGKGKYDVRLLRYADSSYTSLQSGQGIPVGLNDWIYAGVQLFTDDRTLTLVLVSVHVSTSELAMSNDTVYYLIKNKCATDETTTLIPFNETLVRFRFQSLKLNSGNASDLLYMHVSTQVCTKEEVNKGCSRSCSAPIRNKRDKSLKSHHLDARSHRQMFKDTSNIGFLETMFPLLLLLQLLTATFMSIS